jgi:hypothetical protein
MATDQKQLFCRYCKRNTLHVRTRVSEMWGCFLTIITCGLWIPIWLLMSLFGTFSAYRCQVCGKKN